MITKVFSKPFYIKQTNSHTMNKISVDFNEYSNTIRQQPENYLIAFKSNEGSPSRWIVDPDPACNSKLARLAFDLVFTCHNVRWGQGHAFINLLNSKL